MYTPNNTGWNGLYIFQDTIDIFGWNNNGLITDQLFRDHSAFITLLLLLTLLRHAASNSLKMYVNGEQVTDFSTDARLLRKTLILLESGCTA